MTDVLQLDKINYWDGQESREFEKEIADVQVVHCPYLYGKAEKLQKA